MSLLDVEAWYLGEHVGLKRLTGGRVSFEPLFISSKHGVVGVHYECVKTEREENSLVDYFRRNPRRFHEAAKDYKAQCTKLKRLLKTSNPNDFGKAFKLVCKTWPFLSISVLLGEYLGEPSLNVIAKKALDLRVEESQLLYDAAELTSTLAKLKLKGNKVPIEILTFEEIEKGRLPPTRELRQRERGYVYIKGKLLTNFSGVDLRKSFGILIEKSPKNVRPDSLKGTPASLGRVKGVVRIMLSAEYLEEFREGEILVSPMTTPDYLPIMKKAAAFVTDEGGITCHAAIVSREFGVPCIVGTKVATTVLRTGELVDVNANQGVVKKL